jgi:peptidyl-prolyl cis-trans isomerase C
MENKLLATVDGREIKQSDIQSLMQNLGQNAAQFNSPQGQQQLLNEIIAQELLYSEAIENNLESEENFVTVLDQMKKSLLIQYAANQLMSSVSISDEEAKAYYDKNLSMFSQPKSVSASHILVNTEDEAKKILEEINNGLDFAEAASKYSNCPSKDRGGALGDFTKGKMVPEFEQAAFNMNAGETSDPVKTQFGYHLIKVDKVNEAKESAFEEVKEQVKKQCLAEKQNDVYTNKQKELKEKYPVEIIAES